MHWTNCSRIRRSAGRIEAGYQFSGADISPAGEGQEALPGRGRRGDRHLRCVLARIPAGPDDPAGRLQARAPQLVRAIQGHAGGGRDVPGMGQHVEEVDAGRRAGRERAEGQVAQLRHIGRGPRGPRRPGGRPQREAVVGADQVAGRVRG